jgi:hypothetical protein
MDRDPAEESREPESPVRDAVPDGGPHGEDPASPSAGKRHKKDKKHKKEKKHKHKEHKEHRKHRKHDKDRHGGEVAAEPATAAAEPELEDAAVAAVEPAPAEAAAVSPEPQQPEAAQLLSPPASRAAELPSPAVAGPADSEADHEEGELPDAGPPSPRSGAGQEAQEAAAGKDARDRCAALLLQAYQRSVF